MKRVAVLIAMLSFAPGVFAATDLSCSAVIKSKARLACYDRLATPAKATADSLPLQTAKPDFSDRAHPFSAEEARTSARLKGICRGC
jgi:hypothetical protein